MIALATLVAFLMVARLTRLLVEDRLTVGYRRWVVKKYGKDSLAAYFVHCPWCMSMWISPLAVPVILFPYPWVVAIAAVPAASYVAGFLASREQ